MKDISKIKVNENIYDLKDAEARRKLADVLFQDQKGAANGVASLDETSKIPESQIPDNIADKDYVMQAILGAMEESY